MEGHGYVSGRILKYIEGAYLNNSNTSCRGNTGTIQQRNCTTYGPQGVALPQFPTTQPALPTMGKNAGRGGSATSWTVMHTGLMNPLPVEYKTFGGCHFWNMQLKKPLLPFQFIG